MPEVLIPSKRIMVTKHLNVSIKSEYRKRTSSLLISLLKEEYPCVISDSLISIRQTSTNLSIVSEEVDRQERRRQQNRRAARRLKLKRQLMETDLCKTVQTLQNQHIQLQDYIEQLYQRRQQLLFELNQQSFQDIDNLFYDNEHVYKQDLSYDSFHPVSNFDISTVL